MGKDCLTIKIQMIMKKNIMLSYTAPEVEIYEVVAERGYGDSALLPGFGSEGDDFVIY